MKLRWPQQSRQLAQQSRSHAVLRLSFPNSQKSRLAEYSASTCASSSSSSSGVLGQSRVEFGAGSAPWEVLQNIGIRNKAEVGRILDIAENPKSILQSKNERDEQGNPLARKLDADKDLRPLLQFLLSNGFKEDEIGKLIVDYPILLCYCPQERLEPLFAYLRSIGISQPDRLILKRPSILGIDTNKGLKRIIEYLQQNEHSPEQIEELLATSL